MSPIITVALIAQAKRDVDKGIREAALYALSSLKCRESLPILSALLRGSDRGDKRTAVRLLCGWGDDPWVLKLLAKYTNDPDVGSKVKSHLERYRQ